MIYQCIFIVNMILFDIYSFFIIKCDYDLENRIYSDKKQEKIKLDYG